MIEIDREISKELSKEYGLYLKDAGYIIANMRLLELLNIDCREITEKDVKNTNIMRYMMASIAWNLCRKSNQENSYFSQNCYAKVNRAKNIFSWQSQKKADLAFIKGEIMTSAFLFDRDTLYEQSPWIKPIASSIDRMLNLITSTYLEIKKEGIRDDELFPRLKERTRVSLEQYKTEIITARSQARVTLE
jgi:hypothetical protein